MHRLLLLLVLALVQTAATPSPGWPQFRGPDGTGVVADAKLPLTWSETSHVTWKTAIHGRAWSSPVVLGNQIWVTTATADGRELSAVAVDLVSGAILHDLALFTVEQPQEGHTFNSFASPTPVIESGRVYVTFGSPGTAALDTESGEVVWQRRDLDCNHYRGAGSSPILFGDLLIMHFDGSDQQYLVALDKRTGETVWKTTRSIDFKDLGPDGKPQAEGDLRKAFSTPHVTVVDGQPMLISLGAKATYAYDPLTGREIWRLEERSAHSASTRPVFGHGLLFYPTGFSTGTLMAVRMDGTGDVTSSHVAWSMRRGVPNKPSLLLIGDLIYMINDTGIASAVEATTGQVAWTARVGGTFSASPVATADRIYLFDEDGRATVLATGREFRKLAENDLAAGFMASPAIVGNALIIRTKTHLYRIED